MLPKLRGHPEAEGTRLRSLKRVGEPVAEAPTCGGEEQRAMLHRPAPSGPERRVYG